jgi:hypothetical protein
MVGEVQSPFQSRKTLSRRPRSRLIVPARSARWAVRMRSSAITSSPSCSSRKSRLVSDDYLPRVAAATFG